ncbi:MAG TPA: HAMP domain-containing sensor histidine kinase [Verrucomicrobiae bacterium]|nr:HAMP domain-containing sensor histidine kinase [Verrucomicrobiae bacterium]
MTNSAKLSVSFSIGAAFLLAVGASAVLLIDHVNSILGDIGFYNLQVDQVAETITAIRVHPERRHPNLVRVDDLQKWARTDFEHTQIANARLELERPTSPGDAIADLEQLSAFYRKAAEDAYQRLLVIHQRAVQGAIILMSGSIVLLVTIMLLVRRWFLGPLFDVHEAIQLAAAGDPGQPLPNSEFGELVAPVRELADKVRQLEDRASRAERQATAGDASTRVGQNLRNLVHAVRSMARRERNAEHSDAGAKAAFDYIIATTETMDHWVGSLVNVTRPLDLQACRQPIEPVVRDSFSLLHPLLAERAIKVEIKPAESLPDVQLDRVAFEQALIAVVRNAIDASPDESCITVTMNYGNSEMVTVTVHDEGEGMSEEVCKHAFDPFFTKKKDGVGLGLVYAQKIVELHGGKIEIESKPGKGTRVHIHLPPASGLRRKPGKKA